MSNILPEDKLRVLAYLQNWWTCSMCFLSLGNVNHMSNSKTSKTQFYSAIDIFHCHLHTSGIAKIQKKQPFCRKCYLWIIKNLLYRLVDRLQSQPYDNNHWNYFLPILSFPYQCHQKRRWQLVMVTLKIFKIHSINQEAYIVSMPYFSFHIFPAALFFPFRAEHYGI